MHAAEQILLGQTEPCRWAEICRRYPEQYVCLVNIRRDKLGSPEIDTARVVGYRPTRRGLPCRSGPRHEDPLHAVRFTGVCTEP